MTDKLVDLLGKMDKDDALKQKFIADPKGTAEAHGLAPEDVEICQNNDVEAMKSRCDAAGADLVVTIAAAK